MITSGALEAETSGAADDAWIARMERQRELEKEMASLGVETFQRRMADAKVAGEETKNPAVQLMLKAGIEPLAQAIRDELAKKRRGPKARAAQYLQVLEPDVTAFITLKRMLDVVSQSVDYTQCAMRIAGALEDEARFQKFEKEAKPLVKVINKDLDERSADINWRRTVLIHAMNRKEVKWEPWGGGTSEDRETTKLHLGQKLIDLMIRSTGLVKITHRQVRAREHEVRLEPTEAVLELIRERNARTELLTPSYMPMIVPPKPWTSPFSGGYYFSFRKETMIKTRNRNYLEELKNRIVDMPAIYDGINAVQSTPWKINDQVFAVFNYVWDNQFDLGKLPPQHDAPLPFCPKCNGVVTGGKGSKHACFEEDKALQTKWKRLASKVYEKNTKRKSKLLQVAKVHKLAKKFKDEPEIYFPMQYDFRGRMYAMPMFLNPQGADYAKGLLTFAKGKPINDERAAGWLMIHGANTFGYDKVSLEDRIAWVVEHTDDILRVAMDPLLNTWWSDASKPWQFLAFCFDYAGFQQQGYGYVSSLPVALDGSCNGLQHFSAMLRDPIGGKAVNLIPCEKPNDIYQEVCNVVLQKLKDITMTTEVAAANFAIQWLALNPDRSLTKRPVMVLPYGGTIFSCREYIGDWLDEERPEHPFGDEPHEAVNFMAKLVWDSIGEVVVAARQAMDWLQGAARVAASEGLPVTWTTPDGFHVLQAYPEMESRRVKTKLGEVVMKLTLSRETGEIDKRRQASGISPNYVHSMDATALRLYVCTAKDNGIESFHVVHDSFGTTAADTDVSIACLREAFVSMYLDEDNLAMFRASLIAMLPEEKHKELKPVPRMGSLDVAQVRNADYFFA